jgi:hypothetical protein
VLSKQIPKIAKAFGSNWVHLVAHSKGGLNSRWLLGQKGWLESQGVGVLSLITLDTPHEGSVGSDAIVELTREGEHGVIVANGEPQFGEWADLALKNRIGNEMKYKTMRDLNRGRLRAFNQDPAFGKPLKSMTVNGVTKFLKYWALTSDANPDNSRSGADRSDGHGGTIFAVRTIDSTEARAWPGVPVLAPPSAILQDMYNLTGTTTKIVVEQSTELGPGGKPVRYVRPQTSVRQFFLNDGVVTTDSQSYASHPGVFIPLVPYLAGASGIYASNHESIADSTVASQIINHIIGSFSSL